MAVQDHYSGTSWLAKAVSLDITILINQCLLASFFSDGSVQAYERAVNNESICSSGNVASLPIHDF